MKKIVKINKAVANKASNASGKHQRHPKKRFTVKAAAKESDSLIRHSSSIRFLPNVWEKKNQSTIPLDLLLEAGRVLSVTDKPKQNTSGVDLAMPLMVRATADLNQQRRTACHLIPSDDTDSESSKTICESSASSEAEVRQALDQAIHVLDGDSLSNRVHSETKQTVVSNCSQTSRKKPTSVANPIPSCCRPIPPPPRLPRVPTGFAFSSRTLYHKRPRSVSNT